MSVPHCHRCWAWWALTTAAWFAYLERRGLNGRCHRTLSRELELLGPGVAWAFAGAGAVMTYHLLTLKEEMPCSVRPSGGTPPSA